jgi:hypothetical protein
MKLARNYLQRTGYRLPTEAEWEFACRAGAVTSRHYGEAEVLLEKYSWNNKNSQGRTSPVGSKKPNDLGLFDMHGNVINWCQEKWKDDSQSQGERAREDTEDTLLVNSEPFRVVRGGSFHHGAERARCANRSGSRGERLGDSRVPSGEDFALSPKAPTTADDDQPGACFRGHSLGSVFYPGVVGASYKKQEVKTPPPGTPENS